MAQDPSIRREHIKMIAVLSLPALENPGSGGKVSIGAERLVLRDRTESVYPRDDSQENGSHSSKPFANNRRRRGNDDYTMNSKDGPAATPDDEGFDMPARVRGINTENGDSLRLTGDSPRAAGSRSQTLAGQPKFRMRPTPNLFTDLQVDGEHMDSSQKSRGVGSGCNSPSGPGGVGFSKTIGKSDATTNYELDRHTFGELNVINDISKEQGTPTLRPITAGLDVPSVHDLLNSSMLLGVSDVEDQTPTGNDTLAGESVSKDSAKDPLDHTFGKQETADHNTSANTVATPLAHVSTIDTSGVLHQTGTSLVKMVSVTEGSEQEVSREISGPVFSIEEEVEGASAVSSPPDGRSPAESPSASPRNSALKNGPSAYRKNPKFSPNQSPRDQQFTPNFKTSYESQKWFSHMSLFSNPLIGLASSA